eukprot:TRINITY_DN75155_c0_g1_i1.p1 TRINITY_DN75155_c0_g1~~TRINITY_DN75155_c0_g1_i1.p1  ORF type:complete len:420 (-),score=71.36 TRINITY_DN75155_c0_g1_i1:35-1234(-)
MDAAPSQHDEGDADQGGRARADALEAFRTAIAEVHALRGQDIDEASLQEAKSRLAAALQAATRANVSQEELLEASKPPAATPGDEDQLGPGHRVEIVGLESESGKQLNGRLGTVLAYLEEKGRFQVEIGPNNIVSVRPSNLSRIAPATDSCDNAGQYSEHVGNSHEGHGDNGERNGDLKEGDRVEIVCLESESGVKLNGKVGVVSEYVHEKERFKIMLGPDECVSVRPANLRRVSLSSDRKSRSRSRSSSASSSSKSPAKPAKAPRLLSPEEALEKMLKGTSKAGQKSESAARAAGAAAAAAAMAAAVPPASGGTGPAGAAFNAPLKPGDHVEVHGLQSETGRALNGKLGVIVRFLEDKGRFEVQLGMATLQSLKPENLKHSIPIGGIYTGATAGYTLL